MENPAFHTMVDDTVGISRSFLVSTGACTASLLILLTDTFPHFKKRRPSKY